MELLNFIGGEFIPSDSKRTFLKLSPFDGQTLAEVTSSDAMDVVRALQIAKKVAPNWSSRTLQERAELLLNLARYFEDHRETIAFEEALYQGLPQSFVELNCLQPTIELLKSTAQDLLQELPSDILVQPSGVVGIITSWCLSLSLIMERLVPALAAGNVCLVKVSEQSPITVKIIGEALQFVKAPAGIVNLLQGSADVAQVIAGHPSIRAITAVGKNSTIESIAKVALAQFKKVQLSGSVKNSSIVLADVDLRTAVPDILKPFLLGQGQLCWNISRIFVIESIVSEFLEAVRDYLATLKPLSSPKGNSVWTPLIDEYAVGELEKNISKAIGEHGKVFWGGKRQSLQGCFFQPTVILDLPNCSTIQQDELQGPLLIVTPVKYQHEALKWANTTYLGHSGIVWGSYEKSVKVCSQLEVARIWRNSWMNGEATTIFGLKQSSFGNPEVSWSGSFYSDVKKLAGSL